MRQDRHRAGIAARARGNIVDDECMKAERLGRCRVFSPGASPTPAVEAVRLAHRAATLARGAPRCQERAGGRTGTYDVTVFGPDGATIALFRGTNYRVSGSLV